MKNIKKILITVLSFSLLFAISCDNEGKTGGGGTGGSDNRKFTINSNGNIVFRTSGAPVDYLGKIKDTFDYPYTVEIVATYSGKETKGTFTFNNASNCSGEYYDYDYGKKKFEDDYRYITKATFTN